MRNYIKRFRLPNGKWAYQQSEEVAENADKYVDLIYNKWSPPKCFYHFKNGGHVAAIKGHQSNKFFSKIDLKNFFSQINRNRILKCLKSLGFSFTDAEGIAIASTVRVSVEEPRFILPFGFVQSPLLASIVLEQSDLGSTLSNRLAETVAVSVYVDDIILSGENEPDVQKATDIVLKAAARSNFEVNTEKSVVCTTEIEAFNITLTHDLIEISPERLTAFEREIKSAGVSDRSEGIYRYIESVNTEQAEELKRLFPWL